MKNKFLLVISIFEITRWCIIYLIINFVKVNFEISTIIKGETWFWFGSTVFTNIIFAISGIFYFIDKKYRPVINFWSIYKLLIIIYYIFLLFMNKVTISAYFYLLMPIDFFIFLYFLFYREDVTKE
ncbi:MAG TPA: hypothetical protein PK385_09100 [Spirochaetota bacterium]|jgi:hypothetical protein|nr:MAG: hypothetical protein BWX91_02065 [Spirochaetes bacterium ADurb.Bin133]HNZ27097.1 hypothetical protein [Spirochaetota bacterium]HOF01296.1 hypothetical protein [Spirochaetota bacterium]HOS32891.1 hypothetical protein [Spirochaetota bacterium]HOS56200.1 hypothetical protein [Spirochaetota bacterium]